MNRTHTRIPISAIRDSGGHPWAPAWLALFIMLASSMASAQGWATKPIHIVLPASAGGPLDILARLVAPKYAEANGQPVIIDSKPGGGSIIGTDFVAKAPGDGHTLLMMPVQIAIVPALYEKLPYDLMRDLTPVTQMTDQPYLLVAHPSTPYKTVKELIAHAKAQPESVRCASSGNGGGNHLACELFNKMAGTKINHIPYKGGGPALNDVVGGHVEIGMPNPMTSLPHIRAGKLKALAVTGSKRIQTLPDLPTVAETLPGYEAGVWFAVFVPSSTPADIVRRINQVTVRALQDPALSKNITTDGGEIIGSSPAEFAVFMRKEMHKWAEIVKFSGAKAE